MLQAELERIGRERLAATREADRIARWAMARICAELMGWSVLGAFVMLSGLAVTSEELGQILFVGGMGLAYTGMFISGLAAYRRGQERGDW